MIVIIDYGMGNLRSVEKAFEKVGHLAQVSSDPRIINDASHVVLPGVGAFPDCMNNLEQRGLIDIIPRIIASGRPFLGICLGLQLLFTESEEFGIHKGLNIIRGTVKKFDPHHFHDKDAMKIPHMGWNMVSLVRKPDILDGIEDGSYFYFVHSYYVVPQDNDVIATATRYGNNFASSIWKDNIFACQFHPEKSQEKGLIILKNFGDIKA